MGSPSKVNPDCPLWPPDHMYPFCDCVSHLRKPETLTNHVCVCVLVVKCVSVVTDLPWLFVTPWTVAHQAPLSMGFSRQEHWSELLCLPPGDLPHPRIEPMSLKSSILAGRFFTTSAACVCRQSCQKSGLWIPGLFIDKRLHWQQERWGHEAAGLHPLRRAHLPLQEEPDSTSVSSHHAVLGTPSAWMEPKNGPHFQHQPLCNPAISSPWDKVNSP